MARSEVGMAGPPTHIQSDIFHRKWAQVSCRIIGSIVTMRPVARPPSPPRVQLSCCVQGPSCSAGLLRGCCVPHRARPSRGACSEKIQAAKWPDGDPEGPQQLAGEGGAR